MTTKQLIIIGLAAIAGYVAFALLAIHIINAR